MRYLLTQHAQVALEERKIPLAWVERVLDAPDWVEPHAHDPELEHRFGAIPEHGGRILHLVVARHRPERIITAYFDRARRGTS